MATCPTCLATYPDDTKNCPKDGVELVADDAVPSAALELPTGMIVGEYRIEKKIGEGGFGAVYAASHPVIGKTAAIKILSPQFSHNPVMVQRFIAEARAANQIRHRGIIDIFGFGKLEDGRQYYIMELLEGLTLEDYLRERGRLRPSEAMPILRQIARALDAAHGAGIVHRDLKPENVFLVFEDDRGVFPKLLDFGIAKLLGDSQTGHKTRTGTPMGTPLYMSPEQCRGKQVDHRTDIYSFGIMTHVVLTGAPPFMGDDVMDVLMAQVGTEAPPMSSVCPDLPKGLDAPVLKMLAKDPTERPPTVSAAVDGLVEAAKAAGIEVPQVATRSSEKLPRVDMPHALTPEQAVFAQAATMIQGETTPTAATTNSSPRALTLEPGAAGSKHKWLGLGLGAGLLVAGIIAATVVMNKGNPADVPEAGAATLGTNKAADALKDPAGSKPASEVTVTPAATANVELRFDTTPLGVDVSDGTRTLGKSPGPFPFPRGDKLISLKFSAAGYKPLTLDFKPNESRTETVTLEKETGKGASTGARTTASTATPTATPSTTGTTKKGNRSDLDY